MNRYQRQAKQLYEALLARGQTWTRSPDALAGWAEQFEQLEIMVRNRKKIQAGARIGTAKQDAGRCLSL